MLALVFAVLALLSFVLALFAASLPVDPTTLGLVFLAAWAVVHSIPVAGSLPWQRG
jgi:hypothetical protein